MIVLFANCACETEPHALTCHSVETNTAVVHKVVCCFLELAFAVPCPLSAALQRRTVPISGVDLCQSAAATQHIPGDLQNTHKQVWHTVER